MNLNDSVEGIGCERGPKSKLTPQEMAEWVLQVYTKSLQDQKALKNILSEFAVLDYFGKVFYGQEKVSSHLISNLHESNYELSSLSINDQMPCVEWVPISETEKILSFKSLCPPLSNYHLATLLVEDPKDKLEDDLGVNLISVPKLSFPSLAFSTPVRNCSQRRKRTASEVSFENYHNFKIHHTEIDAEQSGSNKCSGANAVQQSVSQSPQTLQSMFPNDVKYLTAYGTIRYPRRVLPIMNPKRIKHHNLVTLRDRFCQLFIGFDLEEHVIGVSQCKIWVIKYSVSSRVSPRNLLKSFNEIE